LVYKPFFLINEKCEPLISKWIKIIKKFSIFKG